MADRERVIQWLESELKELVEQNENLRTFLAELKEECESIRKNWIQVRKGANHQNTSALYKMVNNIAFFSIRSKFPSSQWTN